MRVDYKKIHLDQQQKKLIKRTILENPYIPVTPYDRQLYAIADRVVLESQLLQICSQHTIVRAAIQRKCFRGWKLVNHQILRNI